MHKRLKSSQFCACTKVLDGGPRPEALALASPEVRSCSRSRTWCLAAVASVVGALHSVVSCAAPPLLPAAAPHGIATKATFVASIVHVSAEFIRSDVCNAKCTTVDGDEDGGHASSGSAASITAAPPVRGSCGFRESRAEGGCQLGHPCPEGTAQRGSSNALSRKRRVSVARAAVGRGGVGGTTRATPGLNVSQSTLGW